MTTYKDRAEAYVRQQLPELMELSVDCVVKGLQEKEWRLIYRNDGKGLGQKYHFVEHGHISFWSTSDKEKFEIIGHPIQLQHWLRVLEKADPGEYMINCIGQVFYYNGGTDDDQPGFKVRCYKTLTFNLTTGQPAAEADYQALCSIFGV